MNRKIIVTQDNSKTLLNSELNETYHSTNGAFNEAIHVFIEAGIQFFDQKKHLNIFEMGFGTGLNALLSSNYALKNKLQINYTGIEKHPLDIDLVTELNYPQLIENEQAEEQFNLLHTSDWNVANQINPNFTLTKIDGDLKNSVSESNSFDIVFYDAFGPRVQPELWTTESLGKMYNLLLPGGILVTYCAQGQFKRNLKLLGFKVENLPGPPGKREMTRAIKPIL
ncbi:MAG: tRNA (5-methylaminomethyl-2-thiouridine)(34)-methyltransferase MnmD [Crocinitomix sp.]|nr:tRNA (5-methylaminomethyl-2-thiouridine)(34)-methyltransferase MnmD [Crocinitomix sp.]